MTRFYTRLCRYFLFILILLASQKSFSQINLGVYTGLNTEKYHLSLPDSSKFKWGKGFMAGLTFDFHVAKDVKISLEPGYVTSNSNLQVLDSVTENGETVSEYRDSIDIKYDYFMLPILVRVVSDNGRLDFVGGFETVYPLKFNTINGGTTTDWSDLLVGFNVSVAFGLAYNIPIKKSTLGIELRYNQGLFNLTDESFQELAPSRIKTRSGKLIVSWKFSTKKQ